MKKLLSLRGIAVILIIVLFVYWVSQEPASASQALKNLGNLVKSAADSIVIFFTELANG